LKCTALERGRESEAPVQTKSKVVVQSTLLTPRPDRFTRALPPRGSRDPLRLAEGGALPYEGARYCPGFSQGLRVPRSRGDARARRLSAKQASPPLLPVQVVSYERGNPVGSHRPVSKASVSSIAPCSKGVPQAVSPRGGPVLTLRRLNTDEFIPHEAGSPLGGSSPK